MQTLIILSLALPLLGVVAIIFCRRHQNLRDTSVLVTATALIIVVFSILPFVLDGQQPELQLLPLFYGLSIGFKVEPLGMLFACIASLLWLVNSVYSIGYMRGNHEQNQTRFYVCFAVAIFSTVGIAFAANLITLFIFYELLTLSTYPLVTHKGNEAAVKGGRIYLGILMTSSICFFLPAIIWTNAIAGTTEFRQHGILANKIDGDLLLCLLLLYSYGIGKAALMPLHRWLPAAMVAPTPVSALLHAVAVVKAGVFSIVKIIAYIFSPSLLATEFDHHILLYLAGGTIIASSIIALRADNLKRCLAYSTISQLSYVILATALLVPISMMGAALHILAHAFGKITLFFAAGAIYTNTKKTTISELNGIGKVMPWTMTAFAIGSLSMIGVPPTAGFLSKWYILQGALSIDSVFAVSVIIISTLLNAGYFLPIIYTAFFRTPKHHEPMAYKEAPLPILLALGFTAAMTILLFFAPTIPLQLLYLFAGAL